MASSVAGLDKDPDPSALADRWVTVVATVDYYEKTSKSAQCQSDIESQVKAISALREFSTRLQPYDMVYQAALVAPAVASYLSGPLPATIKPKHGKPIRPPSKAAVTAALATITAHDAAANAYLAPAWGEMASVEITDAAAVSAKLADLNQLAHESSDWTLCNNALGVIEAAIAAAKKATPQPSPSPTLTPSPTPTPTPTGTPTAAP